MQHQPISTLFPYTTLFRSVIGCKSDAGVTGCPVSVPGWLSDRDRKSTRLNSSHLGISYAVFCLKKKKNNIIIYYKQLSYFYHFHNYLLIFLIIIINVFIIF